MVSSVRLLCLMRMQRFSASRRNLSAATSQWSAAMRRKPCKTTIMTIAGRLSGWLETLRQSLIDSGAAIPRPASDDGAASEKVTDWAIKIEALVARLTADVPVDPAVRTREQHARWVLAHVLD